METFNGRAVLAQYFRDYASWQRQRAVTGQPSLSGDASTADDFDALARFVLALPERDSRGETLRRLTVLEGDCVVSPGPRFSAALAEIGAYGAAGFDVFLDYLVHVALDDAIQSSRQPVPLLIDDPAAIAQEALPH